jgi:hypothetical protein
MILAPAIFLKPLLLSGQKRASGAGEWTPLDSEHPARQAELIHAGAAFHPYVW